ncbi:hypothetical protein ES332_1Z009300v1 [Gossypium tomentosum]|uniref:Uncharacterized protein n=1 Tax=Gossypium tomentosum TaxID=34277 RepID=A0A5C7J0V9_GOSTO|nr:hypothetical protein ES332_1Z009300v1 [Gossypium tomentosum]
MLKSIARFTTPFFILMYILSLLTNEVQFLFGVITNYSFCNNVQHGEEERHLNTIHSCVIHLWPDAKEHLEFIRCTEQQSLKGAPVEALWKGCSEKLRLNEEIINKCYTAGFGYKLLLQYSNETAHMKPPQDYVPWVVVNNQPLRQDFENFVKYVCQAYKGEHKPATCKAQSSNLSPTIHALPHQPAIPDFYKLELQWPPSVCSSTLNCKLPIPTEFKIHGIWAQDAHDTPVPPYDTHHPCTNPQPMTSQLVLRQLLISDVALWNQLPTLWPNLKLGGSNIKFWFHEWMKHGTCSDFAQHPLSYFQSAIQLRTNLNSAMRLTPGSTYTVRQVADIVFRLIGTSISTKFHAVNTEVLKFYYSGRCLSVMEDRGHPIPLELPKIVPTYFTACASSRSDTIEFP